MSSRRVFLAGLLSVAFGSALAAETPVFYSRQGAAISGYDAVAYFTSGAAVPGQRKNAVMWKGALWLFATQANREAFEANPWAFAPQFGGYCAYSVAKGYRAGADPVTWRIVDGKLYLIHSPDIERLWLADVPGHIRQARINWPAVLDE